MGEGEGGLTRRRREREFADPRRKGEREGGMLEIPNSAFLKNQQAFSCGVCSYFPKPRHLGSARRRARVRGGRHRNPQGYRGGEGVVDAQGTSLDNGKGEQCEPPG